MRDMMTTATPVAVLVDGDNISASHAGAIIAQAHEIGRPDIRRVYGNLASGSGWNGTAGFRQMHAGAGKNAADLLLTVDAMEMALTQSISRFLLVSSDADFTHLALRLRELGHEVSGLGEAKAPQAFRDACGTFQPLPPLTGKTTTEVIPPRPSAPDDMVPQAVALLKGNGGCLAITDLNAKMLKAHNIRITARGFSNWRVWLQNHPEHFICDPKGRDAKVRLKA